MKTVQTPLGPVEICGEFVRNEKVWPGTLLLLDEKGNLIWAGPVDAVSEKDFHEAHESHVHPTTYDWIKNLVDQLEEGIPHA